MYLPANTQTSQAYDMDKTRCTLRSEKLQNTLMMLCHDNVDRSMSAVTAGTWNMATNAVGDATQVTKSVHKPA